MQKYEKMIALNKQASEQKIKLAKDTIWSMLDESEKITVPKLMAKTGLSRGFFYKNPEVRQELDRALEQQIGMPDPRRGILDMAMDSEILSMREQIHSLQMEIEELKKENQSLKKKLDRKKLGEINRLKLT
ncbi:MAG TPA: hypothetical protein IAC31_08755 [Candidatus Faecousia intestinigallinarum]|nr:hypothetical protein [Candidatus Faecousia intestinigallinarum]